MSDLATPAPPLSQLLPAPAPEPPEPPCSYPWQWYAAFDQRVFNDDYIVQNILVPDQPCMISGLMKTLKTTLMLDLGLSIATGSPFLNKFMVNHQMPVAIMSHESGPRNLQETLRRIANAKHLSPSSIRESLAISTALPKIDDPKHHIEIKRFLKDTGAKVLMLDNIYLTMSGDDWSNSSKISNKLHSTLELCQELGALLLYTHHNRKTLQNQFRPMDIDDCSGAGFAEFAGQWVLLSRQAKYADDGVHPLFMRAGSREDSGNTYTPTIEEGRKSDPGGRRFDISWTSADETKEQMQAQKTEMRVLTAVQKIESYLLTAPEFQSTENDIAVATGVQKKTLDDALANMLANGKVLAVSKGIPRANGQFYDGFKLRNHPN